MGLLYVQRGDYERAVESFQRAVELKPWHHRARFNLGLASFNMGDYARAIRAFEALEHKDRDFVHAYYYLSLSQLRTGDREAARRYAEKFLALYPADDQFRRGATMLLSGSDPGD
jgi:tetratricopeptide (TPR) repeat protein